MSEVAHEVHAYVVKDENGVEHIAADDVLVAAVLAGALYTASTAVQYRPQLRIVDVTAEGGKTVAMFIPGGIEEET